ncbi:MAG: prolyl aminopeptidase [Gammaproteobacteria bacterium]|nr:prolyl aminopeptidase [Gammaproteobacteria bacterium]
MRALYPAIEPYRVHHLSVDPPHVIYVEECGTRDGIPVLFLHGGPGSSCKPYHRQFFDPARYRAILFDQRASGGSTPHGELAGNTTQALIGDIERIRDALGIEKWLLFGGSWGATLAVLYAEMHPDRALGLVLRGTFLARAQDLDWIVKSGANRIFPDAWEEFIGFIPKAERDDLVEAYYRRLLSDDEPLQLAAAKAWSAWATRVVTYTLPQPENPSESAGKNKVVDEARIECHYAAHQYFLEPNQLLREADKIPPVRTVLIHGRRDLTCTLESSWLLHKRLPNSKLVILPDAGHLAAEPSMIDVLVAATDTFAKQLA